MRLRAWPFLCGLGPDRAGTDASGGSVLPVLSQHMDHYSRTKAIADQLTLMANGTPLPGEYRGALLMVNVCVPRCLPLKVCEHVQLACF